MLRISKCRGVRFKDFLEDADKYKRKLITRAAFASGMARAGVTLSGAECNALLDRYAGRDDMVRYRDFCRDIDSAEIVHGLEQNPTAAVEIPDLRDAVTSAVAMTPEEESQYNKAMENIQKTVNGNMLLTPTFKNFDKINRANFHRLCFAVRLIRCASSASLKAILGSS